METEMEIGDAADNSSSEAEELPKNVPNRESDDGINYPPLPECPPSVWKYEMRREMQEICPRIFFGASLRRTRFFHLSASRYKNITWFSFTGSYGSANSTKLSELISAGFTHIVCVRHMLERRTIKPNFPDHFIYKVVEMNGIIS